MSNTRVSDTFRALVALDASVSRARLALQRTSDVHPRFERRVKRLIDLIDRRDRALSPAARLAGR